MLLFYFTFIFTYLRFPYPWKIKTASGLIITHNLFPIWFTKFI